MKLHNEKKKKKVKTTYEFRERERERESRKKLKKKKKKRKKKKKHFTSPPFKYFCKFLNPRDLLFLFSVISHRSD
jgi:hypothetical protein